MRRACLPLLTALFLTPAASGQSPQPTEAATLLEELRAAVRSNSMSVAADAARRLDEAVQKQRQAWLIRDAKQRVEDVLRWLPADTESFWVNQQPFTANSDSNGDTVWGYSVDRLAALDEGKFYRALSGRTVRLVVAGARAIQAVNRGIPGPAPKADVIYVFFLDGPVDLGAAGELIEGKAAWRAAAKIDDGAPFRPGKEPTQRGDENWLALAEPDVLVLASRRDTLRDALKRASSESKVRALPSGSPEWAHVDRNAAFWGLRHYSGPGKRVSGQRDFIATGATTRLDAETGALEIRYLSENPLDGSYVNEFHVGPIDGGWRLQADVRGRGPWPVHFAFDALGFGVYR